MLGMVAAQRPGPGIPLPYGQKWRRVKAVQLARAADAAANSTATTLSEYSKLGAKVRRYTETTANAQHGCAYYNDVPSLASGDTVAVKFEVRTNRPYAFIDAYGGTSGSHRVKIRVSDGAITQNDSSVTATCDALGSDWFLITCQFQTTHVEDISLYLYGDTTDFLGAGSYTGDTGYRLDVGALWYEYRAAAEATGWTLVYREEFDTPTAPGTVPPGWARDRWWISDSTANFDTTNSCWRVWPQKNGSNAWFTRDITTLGYNTFAATGWFEARIKSCRGKGTWPAFWLLGQTPEDFADKDEVDICEMYPSRSPAGVYQDGSYNPTGFDIFLHGGSLGGTNSTGEGVGVEREIDDNFHVYAAHMHDGVVDFYFDGKRIGTRTWSWTSANPPYIILSLQMIAAGQSGFAELPDGTTPTGNTNAMEVDYVRVWSA